MGFFGDAANRIRSFFTRDKDRVGIEMSKGATASGYPTTGYDLMQAYGYDVLADFLKLEHDLMCLSGDTRVFTLNDGPKWIPIRELAEQYKDRPDDPIYTLSFDRKTKRIVCAKAFHPRKTKTAQVFYVVMVGSTRDKNHSYVIKATANHPLLMRDGSGYKRVDELQPGDSVMPAGISLKAGFNGPYWYVFQPFEFTASGKHTKQEKLANLVVELTEGRRPGKGEVVHHKNRDKQCDAPWNLEIKEEGEHHTDHLVELWADPVWRRRQSSRVRGSKSQGRPNTLKERKLASRAARVALTEQQVREAIRECTSINEAARQLGVNWWTVRSHMHRHNISIEELGAGSNHRVVAVLPAGVEDVYDLTVPDYENFAAEGVIVHNSRYIDYEEMDDAPELNAAIDIYADDATQPDPERRRTIWVTSPDQTISELLDDLFHKTLRMDEDIWSIARTTAKYGNDFEEVLVTNEGVRGLNFLPPPTMRRIEGPRGELYGFVQDFRGRFGFTPAEFQQIMAQRSAMLQGGTANAPGVREKVIALEDWEVVHFRMLTKHRRAIYGFSTLEGARWIWKRLMLLEDAALIYRLQRAPERYAFYVDVGDLPPQEALAYLNRVRQQHRKKKWVNPSTGKLDLKHDPIDQMEDFFVPVRQGSEGTRIEVLGAPSWQAMEDIEYFRDKLFAALKIPKAYLAQTEGVNRAILSSEDVRFARTILRLQREMRNGLGKIARIHLAALNIDPQAVEYNIHMTVPSAIFELAQLEVKNARADLGNRMREFVSLHWIMSTIFGMSDDEIEVIFKEREEDANRDANIQANAQALLQRTVGQAMLQGQAAGQVDAMKIMGPLAPQAGQPPAGGKQETRSSRRLYGREQKLFEGGSKESEKRAAEKLDKLLKSDRFQAQRLEQLHGMLRDLSQAVGARR